MNIDYLIQLLGNRLNALGTSKEQAFLVGDLERINTLDAEINDVLNTLNKLKLLQGISQTAQVTSFTEAEVVQNGIEASFNSNGTNDIAKIVLGYDISSYATDPSHEMKIQSILENIGIMDNSEKIEIYIKNAAPTSPLNGGMIYEASNKYAVDVRLLMAIMELDSRFGTAGVAIITLNPGNVGNTGSSSRTYSSWQDGVNAVANWLNNHRKTANVITDIPQIVPVKNESLVIDSASTTSSNSSTTPITEIPFTLATSSLPVISDTTANTTSTTTSTEIGTSTPVTSEATSTNIQ